MKRLQFGVLLLFMSVMATSCHGQDGSFKSNCDAPDHLPWTRLLQEHVDSTGFVSYRGFLGDSVQLNKYLDHLTNCPPSAKWTQEESLAYWINAYNAFTVKLIVDHYPVSSIKDIKKGVPFINSVWDIKFFEIGGKEMDLNEIEHTILRKQFEEPRIHFAIVCASRSCPSLLDEAYVAKKLEEQLHDQAVRFINDPSKNRIEVKEIQISQIFNWFIKDFTKDMNLKSYIAQYSDRVFASDANVKHSDYDWSLNGE